MNMQIINESVYMTLPNGSINATNVSVEQLMETAKYKPVRWFQFWRKRQSVVVKHNNEIVTFKA